MKIAHYMEHIWAGGGVASYIRRVAQAQRELGHEVLFFDLHEPDTRVATEWAPQRVASAAAMYRQCLQLGVNVLHLHYGVDAAPLPGLSVVRTVHGHQPYCPSGGQFLRRRERPCGRVHSPLPCLAAHFVHRCGSVRPASLIQSFARTRHELRTLQTMPVLAVSDFVRGRLTQAGFNPANLQTLYLMAANPGPVQAIPQQGVPRFLFLGRLVPHKGLQWLLRAAARMKTAFHIDVAGSGYAEADYRRLAGRLGLERAVSFHGWVEQDLVEDLLRRCRALVFPSLWHEPGGTIAFEAMAQGRPVVMSRVGGMPEIIEDEVNGLLADPNDEAQLARQLTRLAEDAALAEALGMAGHRLLSRKFTLQSHIEALMAAYTMAMEQSQSAANA